MAFRHTHTITIRHQNGNVQTIAVDGGKHDLRHLAPGTKVPLFTREETLMQLPADWVFTAERGLTFFGTSQGPYRAATYTVERARDVTRRAEAGASASMSRRVL